MISFKKIQAFVSLAAFLAVIFAGQAAHAMTATETTATTTTVVATTTTTTTATSTSVTTPVAGVQVGMCAVTKDDIAGIKAIQNNPNLSYNEEVAQELTARKALLTKTIGCAGNEIDSLRETLSAVSTSSANVTSIQAQLTSKLDDATNYYDLEQQKLAGAGIVGTEQVAREVLAWRGNVLVPLGGQVDNFAVWSGNQPLFTAATTRMAQVGRIVSFLAATNDNDLASIFGKAQASFQNAQSENNDALKSIAQSLPSGQVSALMRESLQSLADTYQNFFSISTIIQGVTSQPSK
jgi:hypothetical protein